MSGIPSSVGLFCALGAALLVARELPLHRFIIVGLAVILAYVNGLAG